MPHPLSYRTVPPADPAPDSWLTSRAATVAAVAVACAVAAGLLCGGNTTGMLVVACLDGGKAALWVGGATALGAVVMRACGVRAGGPLGVATAGGVGLGLFSLVGLGLGLAGGLNRPVALAFPGVGYALLVADLVRRGVARGWGGAAVRDWLRRPAGVAGFVWVVPAVSLTVSVVAASLMPGTLWKPLDPHPYDVTSYHLQVPREWYEAGRVVPLGHNMFSYFPMNVEVQYLLLDHAAGGPRGPWDAMYAAQFVSVGYTLLMLLAVAGGVGAQVTVYGREPTSDAGARPGQVLEYAAPSRRGSWSIGSSPVAGPVAAAVASAVPWVVMLAGVAYVEAGLMLYTALAVAWAMRAVEPGESSAFVKPLVVAGVMAGLACGVKITAVPMLLLAVPVAVVVAVGRSVPGRRLLIGCAGFVVAGSVALSPWLVRNVAWAGNPVWPVGMSVLGRDHFTPAQAERFRVAHSPTAAERSVPARFGVLWRDVVAHWEFGYVLLPAGAAAAAVRWRDRQTRLLVVTAMIVLFVWFGFTHLLPRFLVMLVPLAAVAVGRATAGRAWAAGLAVAGLAAVCGWAGVWGPLTYWSASPERGGLFGLADLAAIMADAPALDDAIAHGKQVALVGDAQAFFFQIPMDRLHYRTVFDLPAGVADPVAAWAGPAAVGNPDWLLVINPAEIDRLHDTYRHTPPLPQPWADRGPATFLATGDQAGNAK